MHGSMDVKPETYKENNIPKKNLQIFIKYLHHSTNTEDIKEELSKLGHCLRNVLNPQYRTNKEPLNLFFVDLDPAENNKKIYNIKALQNKIIKIKLPRVNKNNIIQRMRCQKYGHSKSYCNSPLICVKCGGFHNRKECKKAQKHQQNAHYAETIILPTTNVANVTIT